MSDDPVTPVLLTLRLRSFASIEVVAERRSGLDHEVVSATLKECPESGWAHVPRRAGHRLEPDRRRSPPR